MKYVFPTVAICLVASATARALPVLERRQDVTQAKVPTPLPKQDPWYSAPDGLEGARPGDILKIRELQTSTGSPFTVANASRIIQLLYRSTDSQYQPTFGVTTLIAPYANVTCNTKLLSYQVATDSADLNAAPSYAIQSGGSSGDVTRALGRGWWVSIPDFEGPLASFVAGVQSGHSTIDSIRAALASNYGLDCNARTALWGYSGGALASEWALELQVQYAPELELAGAALGGLTPDIISVLLRVNGTYAAGLTPAGILGIASQYPDLYDYVQSELNTEGEYNATRFNQALNYSLVQEIGAFSGQDITKYFKNGFAAVESPIAQRVINRDGKMGYHGVPQFPVFAYKAIGDDVSPVADTDKLVDRYCEVGATIDYQRNTVGDHQSEAGNGGPRAVAFLTSVLDGTYTATGCSITNVTIKVG